jgi:L-rhamnose mutarotase
MAWRAYFAKLRPGKRRDYVEAHKAVWPELLDAMRQAGVTRESCFVLEDYVVVYVEADDIESTMRKLASDPVNLRWDAFIEPLLQPPIAGLPDLFPEMKEVFEMQS